MNYWLMKSEPETYSIYDLQREGETTWEGVRNYQARNLMRDQMQIGDLVLFYHSNSSPPGVAGIAEIVQTAHPDPTAFDPTHRYFDPKSDPSNPTWLMVKVGFVGVLPYFISLEQLKNKPQLAGLMVIRKGARLSVQPVSKEHFLWIRQWGETGIF